MYYAAAFWFYLRGLSCVRASVAGGFINLIPVFGIATAYGQHLNLRYKIRFAAKRY
jgi:hypothetical protein